MTADKLSKDFLRAVGESAAMLASAWQDAIQGASRATQDRAYEIRSPEPPADLAQRAAAELQEIVKAAATDLQDLVRSAGDQDRRNTIVDKWMERYQLGIGQILGIPSPSQTAGALSVWNRSVKDIGAVEQDFTKGIFPVIFNLLGPFQSLAPPQTPKDITALWFDAYERMLGPMIPGRRASMPEDWVSKALRAFDDQIRFLNRIPALNDMLSRACRQSLALVVDAVCSSPDRDMSNDLYRLFHETWMAAHQKVFVGLLGSEDFRRAFAEAMRQGLDAKRSMESFLAELPGFFDVPRRDELKEALDKIHSMDERIGRLENELEAFKKLLQKEG